MPYLRLPDGSYMEVPDGVSQSEALANARSKYKDLYQPAAKPDTGLTGAAKASYQTLKGDIAALAGKTGLMDVEEAQKYQQERKAEAERIFKPTEEGWTEAPFLKARELIGGSLPYMAAPVAAGAAVAAAPLTGTAATLGAMGAAGLASAGQFTGSNLSRQMEEGKSLKETDLLAAGAAAIPQAALDVVGLRYIPGVQKIFKSIGKELSEDAAKKIIEAGTLKTVGQYVAGGAKVGGIEGATEAGQQFFERLQAGLNLTDENARKEYLDSFIGGAVLGGVASPFGVAGTRGQAKEVVAGAQAKRDEEAAVAQAAIDQENAANQEAMAQMQGIAAKQGPTTFDKEREQADLLQMSQQIKGQRDVLTREMERLATDAQGETDLNKLIEISNKAQEYQAQLDGLNPENINKQLGSLKKENSSLTKLIKAAEKEDDVDAVAQLTAQRDNNDTVAADLAKTLKALSIKEEVAPTVEVIDKKIKTKEAALTKAKDAGDVVSIGKIVQDIQALQAQRPGFREVETGALTSPESGQQAFAFEETKQGTTYPEYQKRLAEEQRARDERSKQIVEQETAANQAEAEIAQTKGAPAKRQPYKEEMTVEEYEDRLAQNLVDLFVPNQKIEKTELSPAQKAEEAKRTAGLVEYKKKFDEAVAYYEKLNAEAEERVAAGKKGKNVDLFGSRGDLLAKGEEQQAALDALLKAKGDLIGAIPKGEKTPVENTIGIEAAQEGSLLDLTDTIDSMRKGEFFGGPNAKAATGSLATKAIKARKELDRYINSSISNIDFARQGKGLAPLSEEEKGFIVEQIDHLMSGKIERATGKLARAMKAGEAAAPEDTALRAAFEQAGFKFPALEKGEREVKTGFSRQEFKDVKKFVEGLKTRYLNKPVREVTGKLQRIPAGVLEKEAEQKAKLKEKVAKKNAEEAAKPKPSTRERVAKEQQAAAQKTGLDLPGVKQEFETLPKGQAALPHNYDAVQTPFSFARQYYKEMVARRSVTMNEKQRQALKAAGDKYKEARTKLNKAYKENNVDPRIAKLMNSMVEMDSKATEYRTKLNLIAGLEEKMEQAVVGIKPALKKTEIKPAKETAEETKLKEELGYKEPEIAKDAETVGRMSEVQLAKVRAGLNKRLAQVRSRVYGLGLQAKEETAKERAALAREQTDLETQIKSMDTLLNARRTGMIVGQAQEEQGSKRYKATTTEKKMAKKGAFADAGVTPSVYQEVAKAVKQNEAAAKKPAKVARIPKAAKDKIKELAAIEVDLEKGGLAPLEKANLTKQKNALRKEIGDEVTKKAKDLEELFRIEAKEADTDYSAYEAIMVDMDSGDFEPRIKPTATTVGLSKEAAQKVVDGTKIPKGLNVRVFAVLPESMKQAIRAQGYNPDSIKGFVTNGGDVVIVASNSSSVKDVQETLAHEIVGHLGVETLLGEKGMTALTNKIMNQKDGVMGLATKLGVFDDAYGAYAAALKAGKSKVEAQDQAVRELIAHVEEARVTKDFLAKANDFIKALVGAVRAGLRKLGLDLDINTSDVYKLLRDARKEFNEVAPGYYKRSNGEMQFRSKTAEYGPGGSAFSTAADALLTKQASLKDRYFPANIGLTVAQKFVSRTAGLEKVFETAGKKNSLEALQTKYYINMHDQRFAWTSEAMANGVPKLRTEEGGKGNVLESVKGANLKQLAEVLGKSNWGNAEGVRNAYSLYRISKRAKRVGLDKLNFSKTEITEKMLKEVDAAVENNKQLKDTFAAADKIYDQYNKDLMGFLVQTGAMSKETAANLTKDNDYIPYYRQDANGDVVLEIGGASRVRVGNLKDQPYLHELVGGDERIVDIYTGALQNTNLLIDMALRNLATRNVAFSLADMGLLEKTGESKGIHIGDGPANENVIRFTVQPDAKYDKKDKTGKVTEKDDGKRWAEINTESLGIPSKFVVEGLAGVNTSVPTLVKTLGIPARLLRTWVTRNPVYAARQVVRDPFVATMASGVNTVPVLSSLKEIWKVLPKVVRGQEIENPLQRRGILSSNVFTGTSEDMQKIMLQLTSGKPGWETTLARLDSLAVQGDAATRTVAFNNFRKQGLSEMEAILATHELMPFTQRGTSSSLFLLSTMVPFLNAQIQGLNVLYKAFTGKATFQEKLKIKQKLWQRGMMMAGMTMAYTLLMSDDEAYQNANDDERYNNWFVYVPGVDEPVRVPIPFELGIIFKAVPEAIVNVMRGDKRAEEALRSLTKMVQNSVPLGPSSIPQALKTPIEILSDYSFYTGRSIVGDRLKDVDPAERFNSNTTEIAKFIGKGTGQIPILGEYLSPVQIDYLVRGYTGSFPLAIASLTNPLFSSGVSGEKPSMRPSETPVFGSIFQPKDAAGLINRAYKDMEAVNRAGQTYKKLEEEGRTEDAEAYANKFADELDLVPLAGKFRQRMGELAKEEREIKSDPNLSGPEKRAQLDAIRQERIELSKEISGERSGI